MTKPHTHTRGLLSNHCHLYKQDDEMTQSVKKDCDVLIWFLIIRKQRQDDATKLFVEVQIKSRMNDICYWHLLFVSTIAADLTICPPSALWLRTPSLKKTLAKNYLKKFQQFGSAPECARCLRRTWMAGHRGTWGRGLAQGRSLKPCSRKIWYSIVLEEVDAVEVVLLEVEVFGGVGAVELAIVVVAAGSEDIA